MFTSEDPRAEGLVSEIDRANARVGAAQLDFLRLVARVERNEAWQDDGARDMAHWLGMRYGISSWKALRWVAASHALQYLPRISTALSSGELGIDKVVELTRLATHETEADLIRWAKQVSVGAIRHRGDVWLTASREQIVEAERSRSVSWWYFEEGRRFGLEADLPAAQGAIVVRALERMAERVPVMPDETEACFASNRRADALVALCSARLASDPDPDRATVVIHAHAEGLETDAGGCEVEGGSAIPPQAVKRLLCNARVQTVVQDPEGNVVGLGRMSREPSAWMLRQVRYRDRGCRFPGCGARAFTEAHHILWWRHGGRTDLDNLALICSFHHRLVHEHGWSLRRQIDGTLGWSRPDGTRYRAGPSPGAADDAHRRPALIDTG